MRETGKEGAKEREREMGKEGESEKEGRTNLLLRWRSDYTFVLDNGFES